MHNRAYSRILHMFLKWICTYFHSEPWSNVGKIGRSSHYGIQWLVTKPESSNYRWSTSPWKFHNVQGLLSLSRSEDSSGWRRNHICLGGSMWLALLVAKPWIFLRNSLIQRTSDQINFMLMHNRTSYQLTEQSISPVIYVTLLNRVNCLVINSHC